MSKKDEDENLLFPPLTKTEAKDQIDQLLHHSPYQYQIEQSRWRLQDVLQAIDWLNGKVISCVHATLRRLGFSKKKALYFVRSPDPAYRAKWKAILEKYAEAVARPDEIIMLFQDEFTYYRKPEIRDQWQPSGSKAVKNEHKFGPNTKARITATLNAVTGQITYLQRSKVGIDELGRFYKQVRQVYPNAVEIFLVQDNWPVHKHDRTLGFLNTEGITPLFLPTYASWLNPIEKLWRWLRQEVLHNHRHTSNFKELREEVLRWLKKFEEGSLELLHYVGLLSKEELNLY